MEEGECSDVSSNTDGEEENEESERKPKAEGKEEEVVILKAIQQELEKDMRCDNFPCQTAGDKRTVREDQCEMEEEEEEDMEDKVPLEKLQSLNHCEVLQGILANPHLRHLLTELDGNPAPQQALRRAMNIPVFTEFADQCLKICGVRNDNNEL